MPIYVIFNMPKKTLSENESFLNNGAKIPGYLDLDQGG